MALTARSYAMERATAIRDALLSGGIITKEEVAPFWPGGEANRKRDTQAWIYCAMNMARFSARAEARQEYTHGQHEGRDAQLLQLLGNEPRVVRLAKPISMTDNEDGEPVTELRVGYRSFTALRRIAALARLATRVSIELVQIDDKPQLLELATEADEWHDRLLRQLIWAATHDVESGELPWSPRVDAWPEPPRWTERVSVVDRLQIQQAFADVHARALLALSPYIQHDAEKTENPLGGWHTFFSSYAVEHDIDVETLMDSRPFAPFFAQLTLAAHSAREANKQTNAPASTPDQVSA